MERYYEDVAIGLDLPTITPPSMSVAHIMRWSASMENWHRIHYDWRFATQHDKLPDVLVPGSWKQHILLQMLSTFVGSTGWIWQLRFQFRGMSTADATLTTWGKVTQAKVRGTYGVVDVDVGMRDDAGVESSPGSAVLVLPLRQGPALPYPFDPACLGG